MFVRTGPNPQFAPLGAYHPFDGDGMLHAVYLQDGRARYRNRWIESKGLLAERARGHACYGGMSNFQFPADDVLAEGGLLKNTGNTATVRHAGRYFALLEAGPPTEFDRDLTTIGEYTYDGRLAGSDDRTPEGRPGQRRDALLRLQPDGAVPALLRGRTPPASSCTPPRSTFRRRS